MDQKTGCSLAGLLLCLESRKPRSKSCNVFWRLCVGIHLAAHSSCRQTSVQFRTKVSVSLPAVSQRGRSQLLGSPGPRLVMAFRMCLVLLSALTSHFMPTSPLLSSSPLHLSSSRWRSACAFKGSGHWIRVTWKIQQPLPAARL